jgi:hypothetical protein
MVDWHTYSLSDFLMFSPETYHRLFTLYNEAIWPGHLAALAVAVALVILLARGGAASARAALALLAGCWLFVAWAFHLERYATINWAASWFAGAFAFQALLLAVVAVARGSVAFCRSPAVTTVLGWSILLFAIAGYPLMAAPMGRLWSEAEFFALMPDPTVVATFALLLAADRIPWHLFVVPTLWTLISGGTLWTMNAPEAAVLPSIAIVAVFGAVAKAAAARRRGRLQV